MRPPQLRRWSYTDGLEGLLFFAQVIEEALFDYTIDTFRPPSLNTYYRCVELLHALAEVHVGTLHVNTIEPMVHELTLSLAEDSVAKTLLGTHREVLASELTRFVGRPKELATLVRLLQGQLRPNYRPALEKRLGELVEDGREKGEIVSAARNWITQLLNEGFAPGFIFYTITLRFFPTDAGAKVANLTALDDFFAVFGGQPGSWEVVFRVSPAFQALEAVAKELSVTLSASPPDRRTAFAGERAFLETNPNGFAFATVSVKARDAVSARGRAEGVLRTVSNIGHLHAHRIEFDWSADALVYDTAKNWVIVLDRPTPHVLKRPDCPEDKLGELAGKTYGILRRATFEAASTVRLGQVLDLHAAALKASTPENQLLSYWAGIETMLPSPTEPGRIVHIVKWASPLLCRAYPLKLIRYLLDALQGCLGGKADAVLAKIAHGRNPLERVAALVALKESEPFRDELYALCAPNPLLRFRLHWLYENVSTAPSIRELVASHQRRVDWHVQRIYRTRNLILHAGESLPYVGSLIENAHAYLDRMLDLVRATLEVGPHLRSLDAALLEIGLDHSSHTTLLTRAGKSPCTPDNFLDLLFGPRRAETAAA